RPIRPVRRDTRDRRAVRPPPVAAAPRLRRTANASSDQAFSKRRHFDTTIDRLSRSARGLACPPSPAALISNTCSTDRPLRRRSKTVERKTISIMKACELVGVSRRTIYIWLSSGKIEYVRTAGGSVRIFVDTLWRDPNKGDRPATATMLQAEGRHQA